MLIAHFVEKGFLLCGAVSSAAFYSLSEHGSSAKQHWSIPTSSTVAQRISPGRLLSPFFTLQPPEATQRKHADIRFFFQTSLNHSPQPNWSQSPLWGGSYQAYNFTTIQPSLLTFLSYLLHHSCEQCREQFSQTKAFHSQPHATHTVAKPGLSRWGWEGGMQWGPFWDVQPCHPLCPSSLQVFCCALGVSNVTGSIYWYLGTQFLPSTALTYLRRSQHPTDDRCCLYPKHKCINLENTHVQEETPVGYL